MKKKIGAGIFLAMVLMIQLSVPMLVQAAKGNLTLAVSSSTVEVGQTVTVTAQASGSSGEKASASMDLTYDTGVFSFVSCSVDNYSGGDGGTVSASGSSFSVTLKAVGSGTGSIKVSGSGGSLTDSGEPLAEMVAGGTKIVVGGDSSISQENTDNQNKSSDNSLSGLKLSGGTLSPEFKYSTTEYTATVPGDITSIDVTATPSHSKAKVESITGNTDLKEGDNTITITVIAENGTKAVYHIQVTKAKATDAVTPPADTDTPQEGTVGDIKTSEDGILIDSVTYQVSNDFLDEEIPENFTKATTTYQGKEVNGAKFNSGEVFLLYLKSEGENARKGFYLYDSGQNLFTPYLRLTLGEKYFIPLPAAAQESIPEGYEVNKVTIKETGGMVGYTKPASGEAVAEEFILLYGITGEGSVGWYRYDTVDATLQRFVAGDATSGVTETDTKPNDSLLKNEYNKLNEKYDKEKAFSRKMFAVFIFIIVVLIIACVNIFLYKNSKNSGNSSGDKKPFKKKPRMYEEPDEETMAIKSDVPEEDLEIPVEPKTKQAKTQEVPRPAKKQQKESRHNLIEEDFDINEGYYDSDQKAQPKQDEKVLPTKEPLPQDEDLEIIDLDDL